MLDKLVAKTTLVAVTNPLHYAYYLRQHTTDGLAIVASQHSTVGDFFKNEIDITFLNTTNTVANLLESEEAKDHASYFAWRPIPTTIPALGNNYQTVSPLEDKAYFRQQLPAELFPNFEIVKARDNAALYKEYLERLTADRLVVQFAQSTGGMGTFTVSNQAELDVVSKQAGRAEQALVISRSVPGVSYGLQGFFDGESILMPNWWHRDLVGVDGVQHPTKAHTRYCGAEVTDIPHQYRKQVENIKQSLTSILKAHNYFGIFGVDIIVDESDDTVYLIEINARFTAVSHLYATIMRAHGAQNDFMTYQLESLRGLGVRPDFALDTPLGDNYFYLKLQNTDDTDLRLSSHCQLGVYSHELVYLHEGFGVDALQSGNELVIIPEVKPGAVVAPGRRVISIIGTGEATKSGDITPAMKTMIERVHREMLLK